MYMAQAIARPFLLLVCVCVSGTHLTMVLAKPAKKVKAPKWQLKLGKFLFTAALKRYGYSNMQKFKRMPGTTVPTRSYFSHFMVSAAQQRGLDYYKRMHGLRQTKITSYRVRGAD